MLAAEADCLPEALTFGAGALAADFGAGAGFAGALALFAGAAFTGAAVFFEGVEALVGFLLGIGVARVAFFGWDLNEVEARPVDVVRAGDFASAFVRVVDGFAAVFFATGFLATDAAFFLTAGLALAFFTGAFFATGFDTVFLTIFIAGFFTDFAAIFFAVVLLAIVPCLFIRWVTTGGILHGS